MPAITDLPIWLEDGFEIRTQGNVSTTPDTYTYNGSMQSYIFRNDGAGSITLTIGGNAVTVISGEMVTGGALSSFTVVASSGTASWTMRAFEAGKRIANDTTGNMSGLLTLQNAATALGNGTAIDVSGYTTLSLRATFTLFATITFEGSIDGTNYTAVYGYDQSNGSILTTAAGSANITFNISGYKLFRARISSYVSGSITVTGYLSTADFQLPSGLTRYFGNFDNNSPTTPILGVGGFNLLYDGTNWVRQRSTNTVDGLANQSNLTSTAGFLMGFNGTTWDRVRTAADGMTTGVLATQNVLWSGTAYNRQSAASNIGDGHGGAAASPFVNYLWNGSNFDRARNNTYLQTLASGARTGTTSSSLLTNFNFRGITVNLNITVASGTGGLQIAIQGYDQSSASYKNLHTLATAVTTTGLNVIQLYPGIDNTNSAINQTISQALPQQYRVQIVHGDSSSYTYSVSVNYIL